jgi:SET domain-containing protein
MYNHSNTPNALWHIINENQMSIQIIKDIKKDEEILVSYGTKYWKTRNLKI